MVNLRVDSRFEQAEPKDRHNIYKKGENSVHGWRRSPIILLKFHHKHNMNMAFNIVWCSRLV